MFIFAFFLFFCSFSEKTILKAYNTFNFYESVSIIRASHGDVIVGYDGEMKGILLMKINPHGEYNLSWSKHIQKTAYSSRSYQANSVRELSDGGIVITGSASTELKKDPKNTNRMYLMKFSSDGEIEWNKVVENKVNSSLTGKSIHVVKDGFLVSGIRMKYSDEIGSETVLMKFDNDANPIWGKKFVFDDVIFPEITGMDETNDGGYFIWGTVEIRETTSVLLNPWVAKFSKNDELEWYKMIGGVESGESLDIFSEKSGYHTQDGGIIISGWHNNRKLERSVFLCKFDSKGEVEWIQKYDEGEEAYIHSIFQNNDGDYVIVGHWAKETVTVIKALFAKFSKDGKMLWGQLFDYKDKMRDEYGFSSHMLKDGDFIFTGNTANFGTSIKAILYGHLNKDGEGCGRYFGDIKFEQKDLEYKDYDVKLEFKSFKPKLTDWDTYEILDNDMVETMICSSDN